MEILHWLHYLDSYEGFIVTLGLLLTAYTIHRDEKARLISNLLALNERYDKLWGRLLSNPELQRILKKDVDIDQQPVTEAESLFVKMLFLHLDTMRRAAREGMLVKFKGLKSDVQNFMSRPIAKVVWERIKPFQDDDFVAFVEDCLSTQ